MRSFEMTEIVRRGLDACLSEAFAIATDDCDGVFLSVDVDVVDPGMAPAPAPRSGRADRPGAAGRGPPLRGRAAGGRHGRGRAVPAYDGPGQVTAFLANRVVLEALSGIARRRASAAEGETRPGACCSR